MLKANANYARLEGEWTGKSPITMAIGTYYAETADTNWKDNSQNKKTRSTGSSRAGDVAMQPQDKQNACKHDKLTRELSRLVRRLGLSEQLEIKWVPGGRKDISGEVIGVTICIYEKALPRALETLKHEVIEYFLVKHHEEDYVTMINSLVAAFNQVMRKRREQLVERLSMII